MIPPTHLLCVFNVKIVFFFDDFENQRSFYISVHESQKINLDEQKKMPESQSRSKSKGTQTQKSLSHISAKENFELI